MFGSPVPLLSLMSPVFWPCGTAAPEVAGKAAVDAEPLVEAALTFLRREPNPAKLHGLLTADQLDRC